MTEKFNIKNIFLNSVEKIKTKQTEKNNAENIFVGTSNIFDCAKSSLVDNKKILEESEKYTKEKYGSTSYIENIVNLEDYTDLCEDLIEDKNVSELQLPGIIPAKPAFSGYDSVFFTDADGNKVEVQTTKDSEGNIIKTNTITTKTVTGNYPYREVNSVETDIDGKIISETNTFENFISGTKVSKRKYSTGITETVRDRENNLISSKVYTTDIKNNPDGVIDIRVCDENGQLVSQTIFKPLESYKNLFSDKSPVELIDFEKDADSNLPGDYFRCEFINGVKTVNSGYHIDENGNRTDYSDSDKVKIMLQYQGLNENIETSSQQSTGDCWVLSGVNSLSYNEKGREIIEDALEYNNDGATVHTYFGDYSFSYEEIEAATRKLYSETEDGRTGKKYVDGDPDVVVFEMAVEQIRFDILEGIYCVRLEYFSDGAVGRVKPDENVLDGGFQAELIYYLTGNQSIWSAKEEDKKEVLNRFMENYDTSALSSSFSKDVYVTDINGNELELHDRHSYSIKSYDGETVTIVNPWNSGEDITISADDFLKYSKTVEYTDLSTIEKDNGLFENDMFWFSFYAKYG